MLAAHRAVAVREEIERTLDLVGQRATQTSSRGHASVIARARAGCEGLAPYAGGNGRWARAGGRESLYAMSDLLSTMASELGPQALSQIGTSLGASPQQTQTAVAAALPAILAGLAKNTSQPQGAQALASALDKNHTPNLMESLGPLAGTLISSQLGGGQAGGGGLLGGVLGGLLGGGSAPAQQPGLGGLLGALVSGAAPAAAPPPALNGAGILGHVLGDQQGAVVKKVSEASGLSPQVVSQLLPALAPIVMSALGSLKKDQNLDANGVAQLVKRE